MQNLLLYNGVSMTKVVQIKTTKEGFNRMQFVRDTSIPLSLPESLTMISQILVQVGGRTLRSWDYWTKGQFCCLIGRLITSDINMTQNTTWWRNKVNRSDRMKADITLHGWPVHTVHSPRPSLVLLHKYPVIWALAKYCTNCSSTNFLLNYYYFVFVQLAMKLFEIMLGRPTEVKFWNCWSWFFRLDALPVTQLTMATVEMIFSNCNIDNMLQCTKDSATL